MIEQWNNAHRIVVKIGSSLLTNRDNATLKQSWLASLAEDIARLHGSGKQIIIVTSGAIAFGRRRLGLTTGSLRLEESQAAAAIGQIGLAHAYQEAFARQDLRVAQILLTLDDTERRRRYLNARSTIETLLRLGAVPIVNENDTVATSEIRYGDNDRLAARVASMAGADCLVLLSDVDGLYTVPPGTAADARHIPVVKEITSEIEAMAGDVGTELSRGGMVTKIVAAKIALAAGTNMVIASGKQLNPLSQLDSGARCTWFLASADPMTARKRWIAGSLIPRGTLVIDEGAVGALARGKSLLPAGVAEVRGDFDRGDAVLIEAQTGEEIGRGISAYSVADAKHIARRQSSEIADILGYSGRAEIIHRDDMVLRKG